MQQQQQYPRSEHTWVLVYESNMTIMIKGICFIWYQKQAKSLKQTHVPKAISIRFSPPMFIYQNSIAVLCFPTAAMTPTMTMLGIIGSVAGETLNNQSQVMKAEEQADR
jgi:hypothetical protein